MTKRSKAQQARKRIDGDSFKDARLIAALTVHQAAAQLGVTRRTIRNWEAGRTQVPYSAFELLRILSGYALPGKAWAGWTIKGDVLWSCEQRAFRAEELSWWGLTVAMARAFRQLNAAQTETSPAKPADGYVKQPQVRVAQATGVGNPQGVAAGSSPLRLVGGAGWPAPPPLPAPFPPSTNRGEITPMCNASVYGHP